MPMRLSGLQETNWSTGPYTPRLFSSSDACRTASSCQGIPRIFSSQDRLCHFSRTRDKGKRPALWYTQKLQRFRQPQAADGQAEGGAAAGKDLKRNGERNEQSYLLHDRGIQVL